jgi:hypothetical protein
MPRKAASKTAPKQPKLDKAPAAVSKSEAARTAIAEGIEAPQDAVAFIKTRFGIVMDPQHFSAVKSQMKKKEGVPPAKRGRKPKSQAVEGYLAPPPNPRADGDATLLAAMETMKPLVASLGVAKVKKLAELLG